MDKVVFNSLLYDFYGNLLTDRQKEVMALYHEENLSLTEISQQFNISRQGVHDALKNAEKTLFAYEEKLSLISKFLKRDSSMEKIDEIIKKIIKEKEEDKKLIEDLEIIKEIIESVKD